MIGKVSAGDTSELPANGHRFNNGLRVTEADLSGANRFVAVALGPSLGIVRVLVRLDVPKFRG